MVSFATITDSFSYTAYAWKSGQVFLCVKLMRGRVLRDSIKHQAAL